MKNEQGFVGVFAVIVAAVLVYILALTAAQAIKWERWSAACESHGGYVKEMAYNWADCIVDGEPVIVPGWEAEQKDKPKNYNPEYKEL